jgi:glycosyltransferase involved in cell wall biosynthesis
MNQQRQFTRCDLHMHSDASVMNDEWYTKLFGCPESYADPLRQYELCKLRGMDYVTLTDHDTIAGGLRLLGRPDFFLSEEVTVKFPENGCVMHVLVWNITPEQHEQLQLLRANVYNLVGYLRASGIAHALAHPLLSSNWRLDASLLEKALVLFPVVETVNGLVDRRSDASVAYLLDSLTPELLTAWSRKHAIPLPYERARLPARCAGSDDHVHRRCGTVFTQADGAPDVQAFLAKVVSGATTTVGTTADVQRMSACIGHTTYEYFRRQIDGGKQRPSPFVDLMDCVAGRPRQSQDPPSGPAAAMLAAFASAVRQTSGDAALDIAQTPAMPTDACDAHLATTVDNVSDTLLAKAAGRLVGALMDFDIYALLQVLPELAAGFVAASPTLFAADHLARQHEQIRRVWREWTAFAPPPVVEHMAVFSDSLEKVDGVASWCGRFEQQAMKAGRRVWIARCGVAYGKADPSCLPAIARFEIPFYAGFEVTVPSLVATLERLWREDISHVELSTPGPMGIVGLAAARLLRLPVTACYHTDLPDLIATLSGEPGFARFARQYLAWFYRSVDRVFAFSPASREKLVAMGVPADNISLMPVAVDPDDFHPGRSSSTAYASVGIDARERPIILSVGRLSEEKNLPLVIEAVERMQQRALPPLLVVVGDGPARLDLQLRCKDKEFVVFLGFKQGEILRKLYASARVFVFASRVDTLGLVNLEALASGVPVLVPADSAIAQLLDHDKTAMLFKPNPDDLAQTIAKVLDDETCARRLADGGRRHTLALWQGADFNHVWQTMLDGPREPDAD